MYASLLASTLVLFAQATDAPTLSDLESAIDQLGDPHFEVRQSATERLWAAGEASTPALKRAAQSNDPEVRLRAQSILDRHSYGIFAGTPEHEVRLINQFRYGNDSQKREAFKELVKSGGVNTLLALLDRVGSQRLREDFQDSVLKRLEQDDRTNDLLDLAEQWRSQTNSASHRGKIESAMRRQVPHLLAQGANDRAESILTDASNTDVGMRDWAVYVLLQGKLTEQLASLEKSDDDQARRQLAYLWRIRGELAKSAQAARDLGVANNDILRGILFEQRDWEALADAQRTLIGADLPAATKNEELLGYTAAFFRLAGKTEEFEQTIQKIEQLAKDSPPAEWNCAEALLINHRIEQAIDMLRERWPAIAFEMLCIQERYSEAFKLAEISDPSRNIGWFVDIAEKASSNVSSVNRRFELATQVARVLYRLGERQQAMKAFELLASAVEHDRASSRLHQICKAEYRAGLWQDAFRHAAAILKNGKYPDPIPTIFPQNTDMARVWYEFLRENRSMGRLDALKRVRDLLRPGGLSIEELRPIVQAAAEASADFGDAKRARWLVTIARTSQFHGERELAKQHLAAASETSADAALRLGDFAAEKKDWPLAAEHYSRARQLDEDSALPRFLYGYALTKLGDEEQGHKQMELALLLPLADSNARRVLASGLKQRGFRKEAFDQWQLILRSGSLLVSLNGKFRDTSLIDAAQNVGNSLTEDSLGRAEFWEVMHLSCLEKLLWIPNYRGYFHTPHILHKTRAQALLREGRFPEAWRQVEISSDFMPGNIELAEHLVPALEEKNQQEFADKLFSKTFKFVLAVCNKFPESALHHNNLAWLCARCDRELDVALAHVERALELAPNTASYLDTLGEVHFRRGEFSDAIRCAKECIALEPNNEFFRQQLERFEQASSS